jgi:hypothetical protein
MRNKNSRYKAQVPGIKFQNPNSKIQACTINSYSNFSSEIWNLNLEF